MRGNEAWRIGQASGIELHLLPESSSKRIVEAWGGSEGVLWAWRGREGGRHRGSGKVLSPYPSFLGVCMAVSHRGGVGLFEIVPYIRVA